jgi:DNA repair protein RecN (Recombination protein N)
MLRQLSIRNYALINSLDIDLSDGLTIITGETGAGKSILLGAFGLLLGQRADSTALSDTKQKCIVEGEFAIDDFVLEQIFAANDLDYASTTIIRREVTPEGKSRAFINDTPVTLTILKSITERLVDIHSQHETLTLNDSAFQLSLVDVLAGHEESLKLYTRQFTAWQKITQHLSDLREQEQQAKKELDYLRFQFDELDAAQLKAAEQTEAEAELQTQEHAEHIRSGLSRAVFTLEGSDQGLLRSLAEVRQTIGQLLRYHPSLTGLHERLSASYIELKDIAAELEEEEGHIQHDPKRILQLQERLDLIYHLQKKHNLQTVEALLAYRDEVQQKIDAIVSIDDQLIQLQRQQEKTQQELLTLANKLSKKRVATAPVLVKAVQDLLHDLGMPNAVLDVKLEHFPEPRATGIDKITFLFSANKGIVPQPLSKVASGGELSRLMLSLKAILARHASLPTIIFDEIDTGISGDIAARTGAIMQQMGEHLQVIAITHLPQVASRGKTHLFVHKQEDKKRTYTHIRKLSAEERIQEIAKMLSTDTPGAAAIRNAKELLALK